MFPTKNFFMNFRLATSGAIYASDTQDVYKLDNVSLFAYAGFLVLTKISHFSPFVSLELA